MRGPCASTPYLPSPDKASLRLRHAQACHAGADRRLRQPPDRSAGARTMTGHSRPQAWPAAARPGLRALSAPMIALLAAGADVGKRSNAAAALALAALQAGWTQQEHAAAMLDPANGGGDHVRRRYRSRSGLLQDRSPAARRRLLEQLWASAEQRAHDRPGVGDRASMHAELAEIANAAELRPHLWAGQGGPAELEVLRALLAVAGDALTVTPSASTRQLAERCNVTQGAVSRALRRLADSGLFLRLEQPAQGVLAARWRLLRPALDVGEPVDPDVLPRRPHLVLGESLVPAPLDKTLTESAVHDAFTTGKHGGVGRYAARVDELLGQHNGLTVTELTQLTGFHRRTVQRHVQVLQALGRASWQGATRTWARSTTSLDTIAEQLGVTGRLANRAERHRAQRIAYQTFIADFRARAGYSVERGLYDPTHPRLPATPNELRQLRVAHYERREQRRGHPTGGRRTA